MAIFCLFATLGAIIFAKPKTPKPQTNGERVNMPENQTIQTYLQRVVAELPDQKVFEESFTFRAIYVPMFAQRVDADGNPLAQEVGLLEELAQQWLLDDQKLGKVMFVQGPAGRGKSVFCRIFANWVRESHPTWTPVLIKLRDIQELQVSFQDTLREAVRETLREALGADATNANFPPDDETWLHDQNTRFLFLLDGVDELIKGRDSAILEQFIQRVSRFQQDCQENPEMGHRVLMTGRQLALQNIGALPENFEWVAIQPMTGELQNNWLEKWKDQVQEEPVSQFQQFLKDRRWQAPVAELIKEPLLLYFLAAMHRLGSLTDKSLDDPTGIKVKIQIYQKSLDWVLNQQRPASLQKNITGLLTTDDLLPILAEAGLCVVQSGGKSASMAMLKERLQKDNDDALKNALATFYIEPVAGDQQNRVRFAHDSFRDYLCAVRLKTSMENWANSDWNGNLDWEIYDLLGYGPLTREIVGYLMALLDANTELRWDKLFKHLEDFYLRWADAMKQGIQNPMSQQKKEQLQKHGIQINAPYVNVYAELNVMILLLELNRYALSKEELKGKIAFYPCGQSGDAHFDSSRLLRIIGHMNAIDFPVLAFTNIVGKFLSKTRLREANLSGVNLNQADLSGATLIDAYLDNAKLNSANLTNAYLDSIDLRMAQLTFADLSDTNLCNADLDGANLSNANLTNAYLGGANLKNATLTGADLTGAMLCSADLTKADLSGANLSNANMTGADITTVGYNQATTWQGALRLDKARNKPEAWQQ